MDMINCLEWLKYIISFVVIRSTKPLAEGVILLALYTQRHCKEHV